MIMNNAEMIKELVEVVNTAIEAKESVYDFLTEMEDTAKAGNEVVTEMQATVQAKEEALTGLVGFADIKQASSEINSIKEDIEVLKQVNANKIVAMKVELADVAEDALKAHKTAVAKFNKVDNILVANTTLSDLDNTFETMKTLARQLEFAFKGVRQVLLDEGIVSTVDQNKQYRGVHLGQREVVTKLYEFELKVRQFKHELKLAGVAFQ